MEKLNSKETTKPQGVYAVRVPPSPALLSEARSSVVDQSVRVDDLSAILHRDPVLIIELLRVANSVQFSGGRSPAATAKAALERVGGEAAASTLDELKSIPAAATPAINACLEAARQRCRRTGAVAKVLADTLVKNLSDECVICGLLLHYGEMLAAIHLGQDYAKLAQELTRVKLLFRLEKEFKFEPAKVGINYLRRYGVPETIMFGIDPEAQSKLPGRGMMKIISQAASEMSLGFESEKWDKFKPGSPIPPRSPIRLLGLSDDQYEGVYERAGAVLFENTNK